MLHTSLPLVGMAAALFMLERAWLLTTTPFWRTQIDIEMDMEEIRDRNLNRECPVKRPWPDTVQELRSRGEEVVQVIEDGDAGDGGVGGD